LIEIQALKQESNAFRQTTALQKARPPRSAGHELNTGRCVTSR
jgi:hypothetical protein